VASTDTNTTYTAGNGLDLSGTEFALDLKSTGGLRIDSTELTIDDSIIATLSGSDFKGAVAFKKSARFDDGVYISGSVSDFVATGSAKFNSGLSGSLTRLVNGTSYLAAGSNITIASASNGQVTISSTGGGGSGGTNFFTSPADGKINATGSAVFTGGELGTSYQATSIGSDVFFFVSGSVGSRNTTVTGSTVFGGDVFVSGSVYGLSGSLTQLSDGKSYLVSDGAVSITSASNGQVTISSSRTKVAHAVTSSHPSSTPLTLTNTNFSSVNFDANRVDIFVNGQLMTSGSDLDYVLAGDQSRVTFAFPLEQNDLVTVITL